MEISYTQALEKLKQYGQEHILRYYDELEEGGKEEERYDGSRSGKP